MFAPTNQMEEAIGRVEYRYCLQAKCALILEGRKYQPGELVKTRTGRIRSWADFGRMQNWRDINWGQENTVRAFSIVTMDAKTRRII